MYFYNSCNTCNLVILTLALLLFLDYVLIYIMVCMLTITIYFCAQPSTLFAGYIKTVTNPGLKTRRNKQRMPFYLLTVWEEEEENVRHTSDPENSEGRETLHSLYKRFCSERHIKQKQDEKSKQVSKLWLKSLRHMLTKSQERARCEASAS